MLIEAVVRDDEIFEEDDELHGEVMKEVVNRDDVMAETDEEVMGEATDLYDGGDEEGFISPAGVVKMSEVVYPHFIHFTPNTYLLFMLI